MISSRTSATSSPFVSLQEEEPRRLRDDEPAVREDDPGRDVEPLGEDGELVGLAVAVGVLADADAVAADAVFDDFVRVVGGLGEPAAPALVPGHRDRFADVGIAREKLEFQVGRHLGRSIAPFGEKGFWKVSGSGRFS